MKFVQINLHHRKAAKSTACQKLAEAMDLHGPNKRINQLRQNSPFCGTCKYCKVLYLSRTILTPYLCQSSVPAMQQWWGQVEETVRGSLLP
jgi:hypothetical protein